jgi:hypothetical protein
MSLAHSQNIFGGILDEPFLKYGHILDITLWYQPQASAWQACRWKHRPSSSAPCAVSGTFQDWLTDQGRRALCETTSVTWRSSSRS